MSGTKAGGMKAAATNKRKYGDDFYKRNGRKGGHNGHTGGFYADHELARLAGAKGGRISRRGERKCWYEQNKVTLAKLINLGYSNSEIASKLGISIQTLYYTIKTYGGEL